MPSKRLDFNGLSFSSLCHEENRYVLRTARLMRVDDVPPVTAKLKALDVSFIGSRPFEDKDTAIFNDPTRCFWLVDDIGIVCLAKDSWGYHVHITFWDMRLRGREMFCKRFAQAIMELLDVRYLFTGVPSNARATIAFARRCGFRDISHKNNTVVLQLMRHSVSLLEN